MTQAAERTSDVIVVGAGPAGSAAAWRLARAGVDVLLIDGSTFPRSKPCGDYVNPGAVPLLEEMGVLEELRRRGAESVRGWTLRAPDGRTASACYGSAPSQVPDRGLALSRRRLDQALLEAAIDAGARFRAPLRVFAADVPSAATGSIHRAGAKPVTLRGRDADGRETRLAATWVIGADGLRSVLARRVAGIRRGRRDRIALVGRYRPAWDDGRARPAPGLGQLRVSGSGCLGAAAVERGMWTVTVIVPRSRAPEISADPFRFYRRQVGGHAFPPPSSADELRTGLEVTGPFEVSPRTVTAPGILLAGDAAGYFDPFTGQGIHRALASARDAAEAVCAAMGRPESAGEIRRAYERRIDELIGPSRRVQRLVDFVIHRPGLANAAGRLLAARPALLSMLLDITGDRASPGHVLGGVLRRAVRLSP